MTQIIRKGLVKYAVEAGNAEIARYENVATSQTFTPGSKCKILSIDFENTGLNNATFSANCGDEDLVLSTTIPTGTSAETSIFKVYDDPISLNVNAGTVTIVVLYIPNIY
jgi:hypothetical protein